MHHSLSYLVQSNRLIRTNARLSTVVFPQANEHEGSFLDTILQTKGNSSQHSFILSVCDDATFNNESRFFLLVEKPASFKPRPSLYRQYFSSAVFPSPPSRLLTLPPPCDAPSAQFGLQTRADPAEEEEEERRLWNASLLEECLGSELGELATLIDDLHGQSLCSSSILEPPPFPPAASLKEMGADGMDWFPLTSGDEEPLSPDLLGPPTPSSVFSADFLDGPDLAFHWDL